MNLAEKLAELVALAELVKLVVKSVALAELSDLKKRTIISYKINHSPVVVGLVENGGVVVVDVEEGAKKLVLS